MNPFSKISKNLFSIFQAALIVLLVVLVVVFVGVLSFEPVEKHTSELLDLPSKNETLKFLGIGMGGILIALQALMSYKRAKAMEQTAEAQADAAKAQADAVSKTEQGQRQDRLKNAIEHLGHESDSVRLGGAYELFHLAEDTEDLRQTVLDILCAHIRRTTGESEYWKTHMWKPSEEVQSLLTLLFVHHSEVFKGLQIDLQGSWLNGAYLVKARLKGANLIEAYLQGVSLFRAHLQGVNLSYARLQKANLIEAHLQGANLSNAFLQEANLSNAFLQGANLFEVHLQAASLFRAHLQGVQSQEPDHVSFFSLSQEPDHVSFSRLMERSIGKESNLSGVIFAGGLSQKDVDSFVEDLPDVQAKKSRERLTPHIDQPASNQLPENSGAVTGSYTAEEAEQWIAEYEQAMSEFPEADS